MGREALEVRPSAKDREVISAEGKILEVPEAWALLPPGDAALSRRIKKDGPSWTVVEMKGRKRFSRGIWAPEERIETLRANLVRERAEPAYQRKLEAGRVRSAKKQVAYAEDFESAVFQFLDFHEAHLDLANRVAKAVTDHAIPVGSGTVARTQRIPIEQRAESAVIAWLRHQTTAYDSMKISRERGKRREVRRHLAKQSKLLLESYRCSAAVGGESCPLRKAMD